MVFYLFMLIVILVLDIVLVALVDDVVAGVEDTDNIDAVFYTVSAVNLIFGVATCALRFRFAEKKSESQGKELQAVIESGNPESEPCGRIHSPKRHVTTITAYVDGEAKEPVIACGESVDFAVSLKIVV